MPLGRLFRERPILVTELASEVVACFLVDAFGELEPITVGLDVPQDVLPGRKHPRGELTHIRLLETARNDFPNSEEGNAHAFIRPDVDDDAAPIWTQMLRQGRTAPETFVYLTGTRSFVVDAAAHTDSAVGAQAVESLTNSVHGDGVGVTAGGAPAAGSVGWLRHVRLLVDPDAPCHIHIKKTTPGLWPRVGIEGGRASLPIGVE